ncbi:hypothetical protein [Actinoplanes sp. GCM10030250]|uniref:HAAS signaling domain-containing protein n=1 Tax=Actinoplanes sp. GCM10030250 TaxID=3273376 RepID=UPI0036137880
MTDHNDSLVKDYLAEVSRATAGLPPERRDELIRDLREHIASDRAELPDETEHNVLEILERLGDPSIIAQAAAEDVEMPGPPPVTPAAPFAPGATSVVSAARPSRRPLWIIAAIVAVAGLLVLCSGLLFLARDEGQPAPSPAEVEISRSDGAF